MTIFAANMRLYAHMGKKQRRNLTSLDMMNRFWGLLMAVAVLALPSCNGNDNGEDGGSNKPTGPTTISFASTTEAIDGTTLIWSAYDEISVHGKGSTTATILSVSAGSGKSTATFSGKMEAAEKYYAFYPAEAATVESDGLFSFELPRNREAGESFLGCGKIIRAAEGTAASGFEFRNLMGFVELRLAGEGNVSSVKINVANNKPLSGIFSYDVEQQRLTSVETSSSAVASLPRTITLSATPKSVFVMLPEGHYSDMTITLSGDRGQQYFVEGEVVVERSSVTVVDRLTLNEEYVDISFLGDWQLTQFCGTAAEVDIYLSLKEDDSFTLYQRAFDYQMSIYEGYYSYNGRTSTISGEYSDGVKWSADYSVAMNGEDTMIWTNNTTNEVSVYERCELPEEIVNITRANMGAGSGPRFL